MDITAWLRRLGLERYEQAFRENEIDANMLPELIAARFGRAQACSSTAKSQDGTSSLERVGSLYTDR